MLRNGLGTESFWIITPECRGCGSRLEPVPGYTDFVKGSKLDCPNDCHPEKYRSIEEVRK